MRVDMRAHEWVMQPAHVLELRSSPLHLLCNS